MKTINWAALEAAAKDAAAQAYAPYSQFPVGVAVLTENGHIFAGCNVENASYGATVCAERNAIAAAVLAGHRKLLAVMVYTPQEKLTPPCGMCRQVIAEFFQPDSPIASCNHLGQQQHWELQYLLPDAFTPNYLAASNKISKD
ncbi:cytidine deaminase [Alishewanella sp. HL-SH05]|uniref:cytidine deaminase n=1 Tax=Alishewanella sp. HL-SH05 TaxID=3461145 RepID=UPI0040424076